MDATPNRTQVKPVAVEAAVEQICRSPQFIRSRMLQRFLRYVVSENLAGRGDTLKAYSIGVEVFGKPVDFDPNIDPIVRVQAANLRRRLDLYYASEGAADSIAIAVEPGSYNPRIIDRPPEGSTAAGVFRATGAVPAYRLEFSILASSPALADMRNFLRQEFLMFLRSMSHVRPVEPSSRTRGAQDGVPCRLSISLSPNGASAYYSCTLHCLETSRALHAASGMLPADPPSWSELTRVAAQIAFSVGYTLATSNHPLLQAPGEEQLSAAQ